jgi:xanthine dehydrogenase accessory factor
MRADLLEQLLVERAAGRPVVAATRLADGAQRLIHANDDDPLQSEVRAALRLDTSRTVEAADGEWFLRPYNPPLRLLLVGAVHIAQPLAAMAERAGYAVTVIDPRTAFAAAARFPELDLVDEWPDDALEALEPDTRTAIVTLSHDPKLDDPALQVALRSPAFYIGALGSRRTAASRRERLTAAGFSEAQLERIHGPVGLDIGARSPAEIAVSILAEITATLRLDPG